MAVKPPVKNAELAKLQAELSKTYIPGFNLKPRPTGIAHQLWKFFLQKPLSEERQDAVLYRTEEFYKVIRNIFSSAYHQSRAGGTVNNPIRDAINNQRGNDDQPQ